MSLFVLILELIKIKYDIFQLNSVGHDVFNRKGIFPAVSVDKRNKFGVIFNFKPQDFLFFLKYLREPIEHSDLITKIKQLRKFTLPLT